MFPGIAGHESYVAGDVPGPINPMEPHADLTNASLQGATLGGANLTGATLAGADFLGADLASARLVAPIGLESARNFDKAQNIQRLLRE